MSIKLKCREANHICDKNQYREASLWEKIRLTVHLIYCRACKKYSARNSKLTQLVKRPEVHVVKAADKNAIKEKLEHELHK